MLKLDKKELGDFLHSKNSASLQRLFTNYNSSHCVSLRAISSAAEEFNNGGIPTAAIAENDEIEFNRVNCLVWVLHESAASFSQSVQSLQLAGSNAELAMAWNGKDVNEWHRNIAYQVYVLRVVLQYLFLFIFLQTDMYNVRSFTCFYSYICFAFNNNHNVI